jgi:molybdate/tungstate transport system substrate-binding protein
MTDRSTWVPCYVWAILLAALLASSGCRSRSEIVVMHAAILVGPFDELARDFERQHPQYTVRLDPGGSVGLVRKLADLGMQADVLAVADASLVDRMLWPQHASWTIDFATVEIVLAHKDHSRFTDEITADNWAEILLRPDVRLGRTTPETSPLGYYTLLAFQLAEQSGRYRALGPDLARRLATASRKEHIVPDETELWSLLEARAVDYAVVFRSTAESHRLKITALPREMNLAHPELASQYSRASVDVKAGGRSIRVQGAPIVCGLTIPTKAPNPRGAEEFVALLLGDAGRRVLARHGLLPLSPARAAPAAALPPTLRSLTVPRP